MKIICLLWWAVTLVACASPTKQTDAFLAVNQRSIPDRMEIRDVPFVEQSAGYCGPATLTMALNWAGDSSRIDQVAPQVYTPGMKGSLQIDMISAARRHGKMAVPIQGLSDLLTEVASGHPVIVFENLALSWYPQWHYAVVYGYDIKEQTVMMHSGPEKEKHWDMRKFERSWMLGDYWGLVVLPAGQLAKTASEQDQVNAAVGLEQAGQDQAAEKSYLAILERWPRNLPSEIGIGNLAYKKKDYKRSIAYLKRATEDHPESAAAWHNRALAEKAAHDLSSARKSASEALHKVSSTAREAYQESLKDLY